MQRGTLDQYFGKCYNLDDAFDMGPRLGEHPVAQDGGIAPLEEDAHPAPEMGDGFPFLLPSVPCKGGAQLLNLSLCSRVPATKGICHHGQEGNALPSAFLLCPIHLPAKSVVEGMSHDDRQCLLPLAW